MFYIMTIVIFLEIKSFFILLLNFFKFFEFLKAISNSYIFLMITLLMFLAYLNCKILCNLSIFLSFSCKTLL